MNKKALLVVLAATVSFVAFGCYTTTTTFQTMVGGSSMEAMRSMQETSDGGFIAAGYSSSTNISGLTNNGGSDAYITKLDSEGTVAWQSMYGGSASDDLHSIKQTSDGGYIAAGRSASTNITGLVNNGYDDVYVIKMNSVGAIQWQTMFGGSSFEQAEDVQQTSDGGYIVVGSSASTNVSGTTNNGVWDGYIAKLDSNGAIQWQKMLGGSADDTLHSVVQTTDGGYLAVGYIMSTNMSGLTNLGSADVYAVKLDSTGAISWQKNYGSTGFDMGYAVQQTSDGGFFIAGKYTNTSGASKVYALKITSTGTTSWQQVIDNGNGGEGEYGSGVSFDVTSDGGYVLCAPSASTNLSGVTNHGGVDYLVMKLTSTGASDGTAMYGASGDDYPASIMQATSGAIVIGGWSNSTNVSGATNNGSYDFYMLGMTVSN